MSADWTEWTKDIFTPSGMLILFMGIMLGWMLRKNRNNILGILDDLFQDVYWLLEKVYRKIPPMKTHRKQWWLTWGITMCISFVTGIYVRGWQGLVAIMLVWSFGVLGLYVLLVKIMEKARSYHEPG